MVCDVYETMFTDDSGERLAPSNSWISSRVLPLVSGTINITNNVPNALNTVKSQKVLYIWMADSNDVKNLVTKKTKIQFDIQTIEQAVPITKY